MQKKMKCSSCGSERWFGDKDVKFCPDCGSTDFSFSEIVHEAVPQPTTTSKSSEVFKEPSDPLGLSAPYQSPRVKRQYPPGTRTGISDAAKARIVIGIIGFIMILSALGIVFGGSFSFSSTGGIAGLITLGVIGFIFLAIATKGEICDCDCDCC